MSGISSGIGLASGINTGQIIEQLLALDARAKIPLQTQITRIQTSKAAMLDVNARLLAVRSASTKFRSGRVFEQMAVNVGSADVLSASAKPGTPPGNYDFNVSRLVSSSQVLSKGFASRDQTPLGLTAMRFEFGDAAVSRGALLNSLRGGEGVGQGTIKVTDGTGQIATIQLTGAVTLQDVVTRINDADGIGVTASVENERLVLRDSSGGSGALVVSNVSGGSIATRLGIAGTHAGGVAQGSLLNGLGMNSSLAELNDGNGVLIRDGVPDFTITHDGTTFDIKLGREPQPITASTKLTDLNNGVGVRINSSDADDFTVVTSSGVSVGVNLGAVLVNGELQSPAVTTVGEMITRVNSELEAALGPGQVLISLRADGLGFNLTDSAGGGGPLKVLATGPNGDKTAKDLGIFTGAITTGPTTIVGAVVPNKVAKPRAATVQDVADRVLSSTNGKVRVEINSAGTGIRLVSTEDPPKTITVGAGIIDGTFGSTIGERTARDLGIWGLPAASSLEGSRVSAGVATARLSNLNGGAGVGAADSMTITDRAGNSRTITGLSNASQFDTLDSVIREINQQLTSASVAVQLSMSSNGKSLVATDSSGGSLNPLEISGSMARKLGLENTSSTATLQGNDLDRQYISFATSLSSLNFGRGVGNGTFQMTDSTGATASINVDATDITIYDVISEINASGLRIEARINDSGDGIILRDTNTGTAAGPMEIKDTSGQVARGLGIAKKAASTGTGAFIDGSFERVVALATTDTLNDVMAKIKAANVGVNAAVINAGTGATPFRLSLTSQTSGTRGELLVETESVDLGLVRTTEGRDAAMVLGGSSLSDSPFIFTSATNTFEDILSGLQVTAKKVGQTTVEVKQDVDGTMDSVRAWVKSINDAVGKISDYDKYDSNTRVKGPLFGDSTVSIVRQQLLNTVQGRARGVTGPYQFLTQVGIRLGAKSQIVIEETKLRTIVETDPSALEEMFAGFEIQTTGSTSPVDGVTINVNQTTYSKLGFGDTFDQLLQRLTNTIDGTTVQADRNYQKQIDALNRRIQTVDARLASKRDRYERQFAAMEKAIARVQSQQSAVAGMFTPGF
jgi:flagellar hook-associated protein 2